MATCPACRAENDDHASYCQSCGGGLDGSRDQSFPDGLLGRVLNDRYRLEALLGAGGFGAVFRGLHLQMNRPVAIKLLRPEMAGTPEIAARFRREAQAACTLRDAHTVTTHDFDRSADGLLYIVMELIDGRSLHDEIARCKAIPAGRALKLVDQICSSLIEAHGRGIVHRDIKPQNILIEQRPPRADHVKLVDFGIAKIVGAGDGATTAGLTAAGQLIGTPAYMAPEQLGDAGVDHRCDIYALGVVLFQMLTGEPPFNGTASQLITAHLTATPPAPSSRRPGLPSPLDAIVLRCLQKDPGQRFADVRELRGALEALAAEISDAPTQLASGAELGAPTPSPPPRPDPAPIAVVSAPPRRRRLWPWIAGGAALLVLLAVLAGGKHERPGPAVPGSARAAAAAVDAAAAATPDAAPRAAAPLPRSGTPLDFSPLVSPADDVVLLARPRRLAQVPGLKDAFAARVPQLRAFQRLSGTPPEQLELLLWSIPRLDRWKRARRKRERPWLVAFGPADPQRLRSLFSARRGVREAKVGDHELWLARDGGAFAPFGERGAILGSAEVVQRALRPRAGALDPGHRRWIATPQALALLLLRGRGETLQLEKGQRRAMGLSPHARAHRLVGKLSRGEKTLRLTVELTTDSRHTATRFAAWLNAMAAAKPKNTHPAVARLLQRGVARVVGARLHYSIEAWGLDLVAVWPALFRAMK